MIGRSIHNLRLRWRRPHFRAGVLAILAVAAGGCSVTDLGTTERMSRGLVVILPGIEGRGPANYSLARALDEGGVLSGIEIFDWNVAIPGPGGALINLTDYDRNREQARRLVRRIGDYQDTYPGRAVQLIGHSGGGGLAVLTLETLTRDHSVTSAILLGASVSPRHDLRKALNHTQYGIFNYYSPADISFLTIGTSLFGNTDRGYGPAAGAVGFEIPHKLDDAGREKYKKLHQVKWSMSMAAFGNPGSHLGWCEGAFVRKYLAPLVQEQQTSHLRDVD